MNPEPVSLKTFIADYEEVYTDIQNRIEKYEERESELFDGHEILTISNPNESQFFNFLLIESENSDNYSNSWESWKRFLLAISFVGTRKAKKIDDYSLYLKEARELWKNKSNTPKNKRGKPSRSIAQKILDIWNKGNGVILLSVFQNVHEEDADARQVGMRDALGFKTPYVYDNPCMAYQEQIKTACELGPFLLYKAFEDFLYEKPTPELPVKQDVRSTKQTYRRTSQSAVIRTSVSQYENVFRKIMGDKEHYEKLELEMFSTFSRITTSGIDTRRTQYSNLLLIDSRNSENYSNPLECWKSFLSAIFYVDISPSKTGEPDTWFQEARQDDSKGGILVQEIRDIWHKKSGVIVLPVFSNRSKKEAELRQAAMHRLLWVETHDNCNNLSEPPRERYDRESGIYLLYKAFEELLRTNPTPVFKESGNISTGHHSNSESKIQNVSLRIFTLNHKNRPSPTARNASEYKYLYKDFENKEKYKNYEIGEREAFKKYKSLSSCSCGKRNAEFLNYLLIDPRKYNKNCDTELELWQSFLSTIFYVGKGKYNRPRKHFQEADIALKQGVHNETTSSKSQRIVEIWKSPEKCVIILRLFPNKFEEEAFTREALMIDGIGLGSLCQKNRGSYYPPPVDWESKKKIEFGMYLLYKAFKEFRRGRETQQSVRSDDPYLNEE